MQIYPGSNSHRARWDLCMWWVMWQKSWAKGTCLCYDPEGDTIFNVLENTPTSPLFLRETPSLSSKAFHYTSLKWYSVTHSCTLSQLDLCSQDVQKHIGRELFPNNFLQRGFALASIGNSDVLLTRGFLNLFQVNSGVSASILSYLLLPAPVWIT